MTIQETLAQVRAKYGDSPTTDECGAICNETAWIHRYDPEKWGLSIKPSGAHAILSDGTPIAADIIQNGVTFEIYDCLQAAGDGGPANPQWMYIGVLNTPERPWKAPIDPGTEPPEPPDPPPSTECKWNSDWKLDALMSEIETLKTGMVELGNMLDKVINALKQDSPVTLSYGIKGTVKGKVIL